MQRGQPGLVHFECLEELFRQEVEDANDIRLSIVLLRVCMGEKQAFCQHVVPGKNITQSYLPLTPTLCQ